MALTLRSSSSLLFFKNSRSFKTPDDFSGMIGFAQIKPSFQLRAKYSTQEAQFAYAERSLAIPYGGTRERTEVLHGMTAPHDQKSVRIPVFVMLPLDTVSIGGSLTKPRAMLASLMAMKSAGVEGVMVDVWWGLVEKDGPLNYNWEGYAELIKMVEKIGLKLQAVMSFHQCGGNVGDSCR